jgi:polyhydroxyalkanoate synthesis regulator phasin
MIRKFSSKNNFLMSLKERVDDLEKDVKKLGNKLGDYKEADLQRLTEQEEKLSELEKQFEEVCW